MAEELLQSAPELHAVAVDSMHGVALLVGVFAVAVT